MPKYLKNQRQYIRLILNYFASRKNVESKNNIGTIYIDAPCNYYHRYFYTYIKFLSLNKFSIKIRHKFNYLTNLDKYNRLTFQLPNVKLTLRAPNPADIIIEHDSNPSNAINLSSHYFSPHNPALAYRIPMSQHPLMYDRQLWNSPIDMTGKANRSIFFAGNIDPNMYSNPVLRERFNTYTRWELYKYIFSNFNNEFLQAEDVETLTQNHFDGKIVYVDTNSVRIPMEHLRRTISKFSFFLCHSGHTMPLCHNMVEALSAGAILIIHDAVAPALSHNLVNGLNCITYKNNHTLNESINHALSLPPAQIKLMRTNSLELYKKEFTPKSITRETIRNQEKLKKIILMAKDR